MRWALGRPGSMGRWAVGSALALALTGYLVLRTGLYLLVFLVLYLVVASLPLRKNLYGDEDELNAEYPGKVVEAIRQSVSPDDLDEYFADPPAPRTTGIVEWPDIPADFPETPLAPMGDHSDEDVG